MSIGQVVQANLSGFNLVLIAGVESFYDSTVFGRPGTTRLEQLKGKRLGISGYGAATHFAALILLKHLNLEPGKDVILVPGGPDAERVAALAAGKIDVSVFNSSTVPVAKKMGFTELVYIPDLGVEVQGNGFATTRGYLKSNRDIVKAALKGYIEGIHFSFHNKPATQKIYAKYMRTNDTDVLEQSYQMYVKTTPKKPYPTLKGLQFLLDQLAPQMPQAKNASRSSSSIGACCRNWRKRVSLTRWRNDTHQMSKLNETHPAGAAHFPRRGLAKNTDIYARVSRKVTQNKIDLAGATTVATLEPNAGG